MRSAPSAIRSIQEDVYKRQGMGSFHARIDDDALELLADLSGGDARNALNAVELGVLTTERSEDGIFHITMEVDVYKRQVICGEVMSYLQIARLLL